MSVLTFITQIFLYFFSSFLSIYANFTTSFFTDTGTAIQDVALNFAAQLGDTGLFMPIVVVLTVGVVVFAFMGMLMITALINSFLE